MQSLLQDLEEGDKSAMRRILLSMLLVVSLVGVVKAQTAGAAAEQAKKEILALENEKEQAMLRGSAASADYYERYDVDDIAYPYPDGSLPNKAEHIKALQNSERKLLAFTEEDMVVRIYDQGNVAVVTSREVQNTEINGKVAPRQALGATVYVKESGEWRRVLHTAASIPIKETSNR
jgi:Domain of unknown function (DUF4440)